jgi:hypothetical protein
VWSGAQRQREEDMCTNNGWSGVHTCVRGWWMVGKSPFPRLSASQCELTAFAPSLSAGFLHICGFPLAPVNGVSISSIISKGALRLKVWTSTNTEGVFLFSNTYEYKC